MAELDDKTLQNLNKRLQDLDEKLVQASKSTGYLGKNLREIGKGLENGGVKAVVKSLDDLKAKATETRNALTSSARGTTKSVGKSIRDLRDEYNNLIRSMDRAQKKALSVGSVSMANSGRTTTTTITSAAQGATMNAKASQDAARASKQQRKEMEKMAVEASKIAKYMTAAFSIGMIKNFISQMVKVRGEFEMQQQALRSIIGSKDKADEVWQKTLNLALQSPMTAMQLTKYTKQLAAFRVETNKLYDTTKMLADVSSGLGVDMERLILAYGHTKASGFLRGMYARQFATAGVNIYGELADYYTLAEKKLVSFKDVYDRISKKLVKFEDVQAVFEKITSQGGPFYKMQEVMSNTVKGQMNKISDSWQQMLNTMGAAETGPIRKIVDIILSLINNWRTMGSIIIAIPFGLVTTKLTQLAFALFNVEKQGFRASASINKLSVSMKAMAQNIKGNWVSIAAGAVLAIGTAIGFAVKHMRDYNKELWESIGTLSEAKTKLSGYDDTIKSNNEIIKSGTKDEEKLSRAQAENLRIVNDLKQNYPELIQKLEMTDNGYVTLTSSIKEYCDALQQQMMIEALMSQKGIFSEGFEQNAKEFNAGVAEQQNRLRILGSQVNQLLAQFDVEFANEALMGKLSDTDIEKANEIYTALQDASKILQGDLTDVQGVAKEVSDLFEHYLNPANRGKFIQKSNLIKKTALQNVAESAATIKYHTFGTITRGAGSDIATLERNFEEILPTIEGQIADNLRGIAKINDEYKEITSKSTQDILKWLSENAKKVEKDVLEGKITDPYTAAAAALRAKGIAVTKQNQLYFNRWFNKHSLGVLDASAGGWTEEEAKQRYGVNVDMFLGRTVANENKPLETDPDGKKAKKSINSLVELLKKMNTEYEKLKENAYGAAMSARVVREEYKEAFAEIFGSTSGKYNLKDENGKVIGKTLIDWEAVDTTNKAGVARAIESLIKEMDDKKLWGQYQKDARKQVEKLLSEMKVEMGIAVEVHKREDFDRKMEELFKDYELSVEMKELKIPEDVAESMFGFTYKTLGDLQAEMNKFYEEQQNNGLLDTKAWEAYKKYTDKIDAEIMKERKERAKQYSKFMAKEISDRAKLEKEYYDNIAMISSESAFTDKQKSNIIQQVTDDFQKALAKLDWETFKSSDFYVEMMDDLTNMPVKYMEVMLKEVNKVIENADILSPRALKEALRARREVQQAILSEASLGGIFRETIGAFRAYRKNREFTSGDEANWAAEAKYGYAQGATSVAGLVKERKLLREAVSIRSEYIAQKEEEIRLADEQIARLQSYWEAYNKFQEQKKNFDKGTILGPEGEIYTPTSNGVKEARSAVKAMQAQIEEEEKKNLGLTGEELDNHIASVEALTKKKKEYEDILHILEEFIRAQNALNVSRDEELQEVDFDANGNVLQVSPLQEERNKLQVSKETLEKAQLSDKDALKKLKRFTDAWKELSNNVNNANEKLKSLGSATYSMLEALGMETNLVTDAWKNFADTLMDTIVGALTMIPQLVAGFVSAGVSINAAMGIVGLIAEAIQLVITLITALAKLEDSYHLQAIEDSKKRVEELSKSFDKLNDVIEKTMSSAEYFTEYVAEVENLNQQLEEANLQLQEAAQIKDKSDREEATKNAEDAIDEINKELEEVANDLQDTFGGIARKDFRSWAEEFVDAWTDAFLETGDGYDALMETFEDKMLETFKKQALMRGLAKIMEPLERAINSAVSDSIIDDYELNRIRQMMEVAGQQGDEYLRRMAEIWDLGATGQLSGLSAGISGMTEETAEVLEGYWNSVRMYTAETNQNVAIIADAFSNPDSTNPMLGQLRLIAEQATQIRTLLDSVTKSAGHSRGGAGIKVFMS